MTIGIVGGGASGMAAALAAAEKPGNKVILFERQSRLGRKLQATGNGRCNLSNLHASESGYHGDCSSFAGPALKLRDPEATLRWFDSLGLVTVAEPSGKIYPYSDHANSVTDVLRLALDKDNIEIRTETEVKSVKISAGGFIIDDGRSPVHADRVIIACGGAAGSRLGGCEWGYTLLERLGHRITELRPSLNQIKSSWPGLPGLQGVRTNCSASVLHDGRLFAQSSGEIQFTRYGLSGPVIFEISRDVCREKGRWMAVLDLLPQYTEEETLSILYRQKGRNRRLEDLLTGIVHNRLGRVLTRSAGLSGNGPVSSLTEQELRSVCRALKTLEIPLTGPMGMDAAQVTAGGASTADFDPDTMESRLVPGLYACGEVLDIDGDCGGYNLQWAWSSGYCAGIHAGG